MAIAFDHAQYVVDLRLILGESTSEIEKAAPFTDEEFYRSWIDPGFDGTVDFLEADLYFDRYSSTIQDVTWKWQIRSRGQSTWGDLHTARTESWGGYAQSRLRVCLEGSGLGSNNGVPFEIRLLCTASTSATVKARIGTYTPSVRVIGESA
jgi:hypothetical protein